MIEEQDDAEGRHHLIEMIAAVEMAEHQEFEQQPEQQRGDQRHRQVDEEIIEHAIEHDGEIGAEHVLDAVGEIDEVHDAEHQRQSGGDQKQQHAELQAVQHLNDDERAWTYGFRSRPAIGAEPVFSAAGRILVARMLLAANYFIAQSLA